MSVFIFDYLFPLTVVMLIGAAALYLLRRERRQRDRERYDERFRRGQCLACGYDLRGASGHCPECGRAIDPRQA